MRLLPLLLILLVSPTAPAAAQPCDPQQTSEVCPDTTDWHRYYPLAVGNEWHHDDYDFGYNRSAERLVRDTLVGGVRYLVRERCSLMRGPWEDAFRCHDRTLVRYDDDAAAVVSRTLGATAEYETACALDAAFNTIVEEGCLSLPHTVAGAYGVPDGFGGTGTRKAYDDSGYGSYLEYLSGVGPVAFAGDLGPSYALAYARVDGQEQGQRVLAFPPCDGPGEEELLCPDTTDWRRYFPLAVGNAWQYRSFADPTSEPEVYGYRIAADTLIGATPHFVTRRCDPDGCGAPFFLRYSAPHRTVVVRYADGTVTAFGALVPCRLDLGFNDAGACTAPGWEGYELSTSGEYGVTYCFGTGPCVEDVTEKSFDSLVGGPTVVSGVGTVRSFDHSGGYALLEHAVLYGVSYGTPLFAFPTAGEAAPALPAVSAVLGAYPNPATDRLTVALALAGSGPAEVEVLDVLGRRVLTVDLRPQAAGERSAEVDVRGLAPGAYVVRLAGAPGGQRFTVVR